MDIIFYNSEVESMSIRNNKKIIFGALSAVVASVAAGVLVKNNIG